MRIQSPAVAVLVLGLLLAACGDDTDPEASRLMVPEQLCEAVDAAVDSVFLSYEITLNADLTEALVNELPGQLTVDYRLAANDGAADGLVAAQTEADLVTIEQCGVPAFRTLGQLEYECFPPNGHLDSAECKDPRTQGYDDFRTLAELADVSRG